MFSTLIACQVDAAGVTSLEVATGEDAILILLIPALRERRTVWPGAASESNFTSFLVPAYTLHTQGFHARVSDFGLAEQASSLALLQRSSKCFLGCLRLLPSFFVP